MDQLIDGRQKTSKYESEDVISNIPDIAITNILDRLPLVDALRTSVLSRSWRFKWTMLSQLVIDDSFLNSCTRKNNKTSLVISRILLHLRGPITKFVISIDCEYFDKVWDDEDISHWIFFLSSKGITDLTLKFRERTILKLPTHLFSCLELKHLNLHNCSFHPPPTFHGFPNLLSLELNVGFEEGSELVKLFTQCPLLEILKLANTHIEGNLKLVEIAKLENLKILSLSLCDLADTNLFELVGSFPKLQELDLDFQGFIVLTDDVAKIRFSTSAFPCLKAIKLSTINLDFGMGLSYVFDLIRRLPNLQTLEITACGFWYADESASSRKAECNTIGLLQLQQVVFKDLKGSENEVSLIKCLLACSPFLKRIVIHSRTSLSSDQRLTFSTKLLNLHRASPVAEINLF